MSSDTIAIAIVTGATAVTSGFLGYGAARGQQRVERARLESDKTRFEQEREDTNRKGLVDANKKAAARRETLYLEYLRALDEYVVMVVGAAVEPALYQAWWQRFQAFDNQMDLFATPTVAEVNVLVYAELDAVSSALHSSASFATDVRQQFDARRDAFEAARSQLVAAMRHELSARSPEQEA